MRISYLLLILSLPLLFSIAMIFFPYYMHWINDWHDTFQIKGKGLKDKFPDFPSKDRVVILQITGILIFCFCVALGTMLYFF